LKLFKEIKIMKKQLVAVALSAAFAVPAVAQNVTVYGVLDAGLIQVSNANAAGDSVVQMGGGLHTTSRLGVRGSEDFGGGMRANFVLESSLGNDAGSMGSGLTSSTGTALAAGTTSAQKLWDRQATIGLSMGNFSADLGRQNNLVAATAALVDPMGFVFTGFSPNVGILGLGALPNSDAYGPNSQAAGCTSLTGTTALTAANCRNLFRLDNSARLNYSQSGWNFSAMAALGETAGDASLGASKGLAVNGKIGDVTVAAAYNEVGNRTANLDSLRGWIIGASLPLGSMTLRATTGEQSGTATTGTYRVTGLGLIMPISAAGSVTVSYYDTNLDNAAAGSAGGYSQIGAIYNHSLSKRSGLYAAAFSKDFKGAASEFRAGTLIMSDTSIAAGLRHSF
jgi:predicted porin